MKHWDTLKDLGLFVLGGIVTYVVSAYFDKKQAAERRPVDNQIIDALERVYSQALSNGVKNATVLYTLEEKRNQ